MEAASPGLAPRLLYLLDVVGLPGLVEEGLCRTVEAQEGEPASVWDGSDPVLPCTGRLRSEVDIGRAIRVLDGFVHRIERWKWLAVV